jgi:hypothetical protein
VLEPISDHPFVVGALVAVIGVVALLAFLATRPTPEPVLQCDYTGEHCWETSASDWGP